MLPSWDLIPSVERIELEYLSESCVRLVEWTGAGRGMTLIADPRKPAELRELLGLCEVLLSSRAGIDPETTLGSIRERRDGAVEQGRKVDPV